MLGIEQSEIMLKFWMLWNQADNIEEQEAKVIVLKGRKLSLSIEEWETRLIVLKSRKLGS